jgi:hypothetical protein
MESVPPNLATWTRGVPGKRASGPLFRALTGARQTDLRLFRKIAASHVYAAERDDFGHGWKKKFEIDWTRVDWAALYPRLLLVASRKMKRLKKGPGMGRTSPSSPSFDGGGLK